MWQEFADVLPRIWTARNCASAAYPRLSSIPVRILVGSFWSVLAAGDMDPEGKGRADIWRKPSLRPARLSVPAWRTGSPWQTDCGRYGTSGRSSPWTRSGPEAAVGCRMPDRKGRLLYAYLVAAYFVQTPQLDQISSTF
jgi:hypothetical protein